MHNSVSYAMKEEEPDNKQLHRILERFFYTHVDKAPPTYKERLQVVCDALLGSTTVGACQATYVLLNLPLVQSSRQYIDVNILPLEELSVGIITDPKILEKLPPNASVIQEGSLKSQRGLRRAYAALCSAQVELKANSNNGKRRVKRRHNVEAEPTSLRHLNEVSYVAFLSNFHVWETRSKAHLQEHGNGPPLLTLENKSMRVIRVDSRITPTTPLIFTIKINGRHVAYKQFESGKERVVVYTPHLKVDTQDDAKCWSWLLAHLPWNEDGEAGLLRHPLEQKEPFLSAIDAFSYYVSTESHGFPAYVWSSVQEQRLYQERRNDDRDDFRQRERDDDHDSPNDESVRHSNGSALNASLWMPDDDGEGYLRDDSTGGNDITDATYSFSDDDRVKHDMTSADRTNYSNFITDHLKDHLRNAGKANERPLGIGVESILSSSSSSSFAPFQTIVKYPNHDELVDTFNTTVLTKLGADQKQALRRILPYIKCDPASDPSTQLIFFLSGEGGTGKSELVKILRDACKVIFGRNGPMEPMISLTPTGSSAFSINGFTWHNILNGPLKKKKRELTATNAHNIATRLKGSHVINIDEVSMLGCKHFADINLILQQARGAMACTSDVERERRDKLKSLPFGGFHMLLTGDFYQFPPVMETALYIPDRNLKDKDAEGRRLWVHQVTQFHELTENFRARPSMSVQQKPLSQNSDGGHSLTSDESSEIVPSNVLAQFLQGARLGRPNLELLDIINKQCLQRHRFTDNIDSRALWMAPSRKEVDIYNDEAFDRLESMGYPKYRAVARHVLTGHGSHIDVSDNNNAQISEALFKHTESSSDFNDSHGAMPSGDLSLILGQRVRVLKNMATALGIYQGAMGTVVGFVFDSSKPRLSDQQMFPSRNNNAAFRVSLNKTRNQNLPVVLVQMDKVVNNISCKDELPNVIPFLPIEHLRGLHHEGKTYYRKQYPLVPAQATTFHRAQGQTALYGIVMAPEQGT